ncbi:MAG: putative lipid II flippase FtsW [Spirochaetales bacterium]|nr:putative lipid II flippase FtsW [Spirochaetales bacterium]
MKVFTVERGQKQNVDFTLLLIVLVLLGTGLAALFSSSWHYAERLMGRPDYFIRKQAIFALLGLILFVPASRISPDFLRKTVPGFLFLSLFLLLLTFVPGIGRPIMGARRWIYIFGYSFQPSELAKCSLLLYLAHIFSKKDERMDDLVNSILPPLLVSLAFIMLVYLQNDFSTAFFMLMTTLFMFFIANVRVIYFIILGSVMAPLAGILLFTKEHRVERILTFLDPTRDPVGSGFQVIAAQTALENGGALGLGIGKGMKKLGGLPEVYSDFVFASLGEETGFIGVVFVLSLFACFALRGYAAALGTKDRFSFYLAFGITTSILFQALINMAVVSGLVPATGIPLPFFSSGGSSLLVTMLMAGLLLNVSRRRDDVKGRRI